TMFPLLLRVLLIGGPSRRCDPLGGGEAATPSLPTIGLTCATADIERCTNTVDQEGEPPSFGGLSPGALPSPFGAPRRWPYFSFNFRRPSRSTFSRDRGMSQRSRWRPWYASRSQVMSILRPTRLTCSGQAGSSCSRLLISTPRVFKAARRMLKLTSPTRYCRYSLSYWGQSCSWPCPS